MSYEIIYDRLFIKTHYDSYIPMLLAGSNNCYDSGINGRIGKRARSWYNDRFFAPQVIVSESELIENINKFRQGYINSGKARFEVSKDESDLYEDKRFGWFTAITLYGRTTRSTTFSKFLSYYKNGMKNAMTIEELNEKNIGVEIRIDASLYGAEAEKEGIEIKQPVRINSTEQLIATVNEWNVFYKNSKINFWVRFTNDWAIDRMKSDRWLDKRIARGKRNKQRIEVGNYYVLHNENTGYLLKRTRRGYKYAYYPESAKKFKTEKQANTYRTNAGYEKTFEIKNIDKPTVFLK